MRYAKRQQTLFHFQELPLKKEEIEPDSIVEETDERIKSLKPFNDLLPTKIVPEIEHEDEENLESEKNQTPLTSIFTLTSPEVLMANRKANEEGKKADVEAIAEEYAKQQKTLFNFQKFPSHKKETKKDFVAEEANENTNVERPLVNLQPNLQVHDNIEERLTIGETIEKPRN